MAKADAAPKLNRERLDHLHAHAATIRACVGAVNDEPVDAFAIAEQLGVAVTSTDALDATDFSGHLRVVNGKPIAVLNSLQTPERQNVTLLEEICHLHYQHPLSELSDCGRDYDSAIEQEAFQTAAAILLPAVVVARTVFHGTPVAEVARTYGASEELFLMRIKVMGLWPLYKGAA